MRRTLHHAPFTRRAAFLAVIFMMAGGCALQQDLVAVDSRVARQQKKAEADRAALRSEIAKYHQEQLKLDEGYRNRHAELHTLMNELREEMQALQGQAEESTHDIQRRITPLSESAASQEEHWKNLEKQLQMSLLRITRLEEYLGLEPSEKPVPVESKETEADKGEAKGEKTPEGLYEEAKTRFDQGEYEEARELFQAYLDQYAQSKNADNAQFWIGEIYYHEKWYEKAILEYQKVIENHPKGNKVSSALLKQGFAFSNLGDNANAKLVLKELVRKYPDSTEAKIAKKKLQALQ